MSRPARPTCLDVDLEAWQPAVQHRPRQVNGRARQRRAQQAAAGRMGIPLDPHVLALHRIAHAGNRPVDGQVQIMAVKGQRGDRAAAGDLDAQKRVDAPAAIRRGLMARQGFVRGRAKRNVIRSP